MKCMIPQTQNQIIRGGEKLESETIENWRQIGEKYVKSTSVHPATNENRWIPTVHTNWKYRLKANGK